MKYINNNDGTLTITTGLTDAMLIFELNKDNEVTISALRPPNKEGEVVPQNILYATIILELFMQVDGLINELINQWYAGVADGSIKSEIITTPKIIH